MLTVLNPLTCSFPAGRYSGVRLRIAFALPVLCLLITWKTGTVAVGAVLVACLLMSSLLHGVFQVVAARKAGGEVSEIMLWPLGCLVKFQHSFRLRNRLFTLMVGPLTHLMLALITLPFISELPQYDSLLNLATAPLTTFSTTSPAAEVLLLLFYVNWILMVINLLPILPTDGGKFVEEILLNQFSHKSVTRVMHGVTTFAGFTLLLMGVAVSQAWLSLFGAFLICWTLYEKITSHETAPQKDESEFFLGYDFSAGYTSLEESKAVEQKTTQTSWWARRKKSRQLAMKRKAEVKRLQAQQQVDQLLAKVSESGMASLTAAEHRQLKQASLKLRSDQ